MAQLPPTDPLTIKCQCAELWSHPAAQLLIGRALRPGGAELTQRLLTAAGLRRCSLVLDVGCGPGSTLELVAAAGHRPIGVDLSRSLAADAAGGDASAIVGDAERLPIRSGAADAALAECVISALPDKAAAIDELHRVIRPGGVLIVTDMTLAAPLPEPLNTALAWAACAAGALSASGYTTMLDAAGFEVRSSEDHSDDILAMVARARRRLALFRGASGVGLLPPLEQFLGPALVELATATLGHEDLHAGGQHILGQASETVEQGTMGYVAITAEAR